ncbi:hypothetical protein ABRP62_00005 [Corynebacterium sp. KPL2636]|uniref:hypothetical protein n=1 Tax=Corynebacterium sp. KPL2636 TaxID=3158309 RepID=UPI0032ED36A3
MPAVAEERFEGVAVVERGGGFGVHVGCLVVSGCVDADVGDGFAGFVGDDVELLGLPANRGHVVKLLRG